MNRDMTFRARAARGTLSSKLILRIWKCFLFVDRNKRIREIEDNIMV